MINCSKWKIDALATLLCLLCAGWLQNHLYLDWDVAWHVTGAERLFSGNSSYLVNLFDTNAPTVFAFFVPLIWIKQAFGLFLSPQLVIMYLFSINLVLLALCYYVICKADTVKMAINRHLLYTVLLFIYFLLPALSLGHREVILIAFYLPYFLYLIFSTVDSHLKFHLLFLLTIAVIAAFGISQNLFFLIMACLVDVCRYVISKRFDKPQWAFYLTIFFIIVVILMKFPEYFKTIVPMVLCYENGLNHHFFWLIVTVPTFLCIVTLLYFVLNFSRLSPKPDLLLCFVAGSSALLIYLIEQKIWYYHVYPAIAFTVLLLSFLVVRYFPHTKAITNSDELTFADFGFALAMLMTMFMAIGKLTIVEIRYYNSPTNDHRRWMTYVQKNFNNKKVSSIVMRLATTHLIPFYTKNVTTYTPWSNPWLLAFVNKPDEGKSCPNLKKDTIFIQQLEINALRDFKPDFFIVENSLYGTLYNKRPFTLLDFFVQNPDFAILLKQYKKYDQFGTYTIYQRIN